MRPGRDVGKINARSQWRNDPRVTTFGGQRLPQRPSERPRPVTRLFTSLSNANMAEDTNAKKMGVWRRGFACISEVSGPRKLFKSDSLVIALSLKTTFKRTTTFDELATFRNPVVGVYRRL